VDYPSYMRWLPPETANVVGRLEFLAHGVVDGFISGKHRSHRKGASTEFAEHRAYMPGDDLRNLDWKVLARHRRYTIKQFVDETNLRATILLDVSGSMKYRGEKAARVGGKILSKLEYGQYLAAALTYLLVRQQDAVGFVPFDTEVKTYVPARAKPSQIRLVLEEIDKLSAGGETDPAAVFHDIAERIPRRGVVFVISDLFGDPDAILNALHHFRFRHHEVVVFHVMAEEEFTFPFDDYMRFECAETGAKMQVDPRALKADYLDNVDSFVQKLKGGCGEMSVSYEPVSTQTPFDRALADVLARRQRGRG